MAYLARVADEQLRQRLDAVGAVVIEGPKACGKTWTARQFARSEVLLDTDLNAARALAVDPSLVLAGTAPRLIDEWQVGGTELWNRVRREVDDRAAPGQFILTGSATPADDVRRHSGAGRFSRLRMRPMSLHELGRSSGEVSLSALLDGERPSGRASDVSVPDLVEQIAVGGWPSNLNRSVQSSLRANVDYLADAREVDVPGIAGARRDPLRLDRIITALARNVATEVKITSLAADAEVDGVPLSRSAVYEYLAALQRLMLLDDVPAWSTHLRSRATLRKEPKRHFVDPSLAVAALRTSPARLLADLSYTGFLFESLVVRDLRVLSGPLDGTVYHYRDSNGVEVDVVLEVPGGRWSAFEVKLGTGEIETAAASLLKFASVIDIDKVGLPGALGVITTGEYAYARPDGVSVIPIGALAP